MGYDSPAHTKTMIAGAAIKKGQILKLSSGKVIPCSVAGEAFFGVAINDAVLDAQVAVCIGGECDVQTAEVIGASNVLTRFMTDANARAITATGSGKYVVGLILETGYAVIGTDAATRRCAVRLNDTVLP